jgi:nicotinamide mononucleotide adenylyltransferase
MQVQWGVVHGRFQPIHLDHIRYILEAARRCEFLYIGITNPDPSKTKVHESDIKRSQDSANPLSYWERCLLVRASMQDFGLDPTAYSTVPFPINLPHLLQYYVPTDARFFMTVYDAWGRAKREILQSLGFDVETLWERDIAEKGITGTSIRDRIAIGAPWEHDVPQSVARLIEELSLDVRIRSLCAHGDQADPEQ